MKQRLEYYKVAPSLFEPMVALEKALASSSLGKTIIELVKIRASQINGCAYCLDMHLRDARAAGIPEQKLDVVAAAVLKANNSQMRAPADINTNTLGAMIGN